ncbi:MAG: HAD family hydrolase [Agarilytica sp.]
MILLAEELHKLENHELKKQHIKVAFFDIDGTLLGLDGQYSDASKQQILRLKASGIKVAIASGRPNFAAKFIVDELSISDPGVFCTGAHVYCPTTRNTLVMQGVSASLSQRLTEALRNNDIYYELYTAEDYFIESDKCEDIGKTHASHMRQAPQNRNFDALIGVESVVKFLIAVDSVEEHEKLFDLERAFPECQFAYAKIAAHPDWLFASVIDKDACKHQAFDYLLDYYKVSAENVISFGDAQSDKVFLERAGTGVAMGQAADDVKSVANYVTRPVWDDGVAYAISRLIQ